jgi:hypothetical protein
MTPGTNPATKKKARSAGKKRIPTEDTDVYPRPVRVLGRGSVRRTRRRRSWAASGGARQKQKNARGGRRSVGVVTTAFAWKGKKKGKKKTKKTTPTEQLVRR